MDSISYIYYNGEDDKLYVRIEGLPSNVLNDVKLRGAARLVSQSTLHLTRIVRNLSHMYDKTRTSLYQAYLRRKISRTVQNDVKVSAMTRCITLLETAYVPRPKRRRSICTTMTPLN